MKRIHEVRSQQTLDTLTSLKQEGVEKIGLLLRHSERFFCEDARMEPFMGLTEEGKTYAVDMGKNLTVTPLPCLKSSFFGRCIETAYLIDKGFSQAHGTCLSHNCTDHTLAPFYIKEIEAAINMVDEQGSKRFLRNWFDHKIDESVMENPETSCDRLCEFMKNEIASLAPQTVSICISHDWNIFPIKEFKMGLTHEASGDVGYLDGLAFFEKQGQYYVTNYQTGPVLI